MLKNHIGRLVVVDRNDPKHVVGYLGRAAILSARLRRLEEECVREKGWFRLSADRQAALPRNNPLQEVSCLHPGSS